MSIPVSTYLIYCNTSHSISQNMRCVHDLMEISIFHATIFTITQYAKWDTLHLFPNGILLKNNKTYLCVIWRKYEHTFTRVVMHNKIMWTTHCALWYYDIHKVCSNFYTLHWLSYSSCFVYLTACNYFAIAIAFESCCLMTNSTLYKFKIELPFQNSN